MHLILQRPLIRPTAFSGCRLTEMNVWRQTGHEHTTYTPPCSHFSDFLPPGKKHHSGSFYPLLSEISIALYFVVVQNRNITSLFSCPPHTCTHKKCTCIHAQHQIHIPLGHAFFCSPDCDKLVQWINRGLLNHGLGSREMCTTARAHTHTLGIVSEQVKCGRD